MKNFLKSYWKTLAFFTAAGLIGGFFVGLYLLDSYPADIVQQILDQGLTPFTLGLLTACQSAGYGLVLGALGLANMWIAIIADVGVMILAVLNAIRCLFVKDL